MIRNWKCVGWIVLTLGAVSPVLAQTTVTLNGRTMTKEVRTVGGQAYVPLSDVAKALGMVVVKTPDGYQLVAAGGANQLAGRATGKLGDDIFTGEWRFMVTSVHSVDRYPSRYRAAKTEWSPKSTADQLVVVNCRIKNGRPNKELVLLNTQYGTGMHTALTDTTEHSYEVLAYDVHHDYYDYAATALPGAAVDFAIVFSIPKNAKPKSLVFTISRYDDRGDTSKHTDVRVTLR